MLTSDVVLEPQQIGIPSGLRLRPRETNAEYIDDEGDRGPYMEQVPLPENERIWAKCSALGCLADLAGSLVILVTAFKYAYRDHGVSLYSLGFQATSHWLASALLLLRLLGELRLGRTKEQSLLLQQRRTLLQREQLLSMCMGIVLLFSATGLLFKACTKLRFWDRWLDHLERDRAQTEIQLITEWLAWTGFSIYSLQALLRAFSIRQTGISGLTHSLVVSIVSLLFLLVLGIAASFENEGTWKAEPIAAIVLVFVTLFEGVRIAICYLDDMNDRLRHSSRP